MPSAVLGALVAGGLAACGATSPAPSAGPVPSSAQSTPPSTPPSASPSSAHPSSAPGRADAGTGQGAGAEQQRVVGLPTGVEDGSRPVVAAPRRIRVPSLGIDSALDRLGLRGDAELQAPPRWGVAGWFTDAARPGERGPAVIAGHLDSPSGPAVFARLPAIGRGDRIDVTDVAGTTHTFAVDRVTRTPKVGFPTEAVYGAVPGAELRLITCTGSYVPEDGGYQDNLLVFASLVRG